MRDLPADLLRRLRKYDQEHVLLGWDSLVASDRQALVGQLAAVNLEEIRDLFGKRDQVQSLPSVDRIAPAVMVPHDALSDSNRQIGEQMLKSGEVAVLLVAGGQGSRLGFDNPKGMFPIGPVTNKSLFQIHAEKVAALGRKYGRTVPFLVMTSPATHDDTITYFKEHKYFGLSEPEVYFFQQDTMPAVDITTGRLLLEKTGLLFTSPNGHGGTLTALADSGLLDAMRKRGIRNIFYFQVDNPLVKVAEPAFLGRHKEDNAEVSSKAIEKAYAKEKMGVLALIEGRCSIIEYIDLPEQLLHATDRSGKLLYRAGSPAIHIFEIDFLTRITQGSTRLPFHIARKKVPCIDEQGHAIIPTKENALKFELFIFDALPLAERWLVLEALRSEEFSPVKNAEGVDSPETAKRDLMNQAGRWLEQAGARVPRDAKGNVAVPLEVSPLFAIDPKELAAKISTGRVIEGPTYLE